MNKYLVMSLIANIAGFIMVAMQKYEYCALCWAVSAMCHSAYTLERVEKLEKRKDKE